MSCTVTAGGLKQKHLPVYKSRTTKHGVHANCGHCIGRTLYTRNYFKQEEDRRGQGVLQSKVCTSKNLIYILRALPGAAGPPFWTPWLAERRSCIHLRLEHSAVAVVIFFLFFSSPVCFSVYFFGSAFCLVSVTHGSSAFAASVALVLILLRMMFCFLSDDVFLHIMVFFLLCGRHDGQCPFVLYFVFV